MAQVFSLVVDTFHRIFWLFLAIATFCKRPPHR